MKGFLFSPAIPHVWFVFSCVILNKATALSLLNMSHHIIRPEARVNVVPCFTYKAALNRIIISDLNQALLLWDRYPQTCGHTHVQTTFITSETAGTPWTLFLFLSSLPSAFINSFLVDSLHLFVVSLSRWTSLSDSFNCNHLPCYSYVNTFALMISERQHLFCCFLCKFFAKCSLIGPVSPPGGIRLGVLTALCSV